MNWEDIKYSLSTAEKNFEQLDANTFQDFEVSEKYSELRNDFVALRDKVFDEHNFDNVEKLGYDFDLTYGLEIYELLNSKYDFKLRHAANNEIWRFLQIEIIPDIVHSRWEFNEANFTLLIEDCGSKPYGGTSISGGTLIKIQPIIILKIIQQTRSCNWWNDRALVII